MKIFRWQNAYFFIFCSLGVLVSFFFYSNGSLPFLSYKFNINNFTDIKEVSLATFLNIALVLFYALLQYILCKLGRNSISDHRKWADSVYFLGFFLTLVALIFSLIKVNAEGGESIIAGKIVQNAIALSSTAAALVIRTLWVNSLKDNAEAEGNLLQNELNALSSGITALGTAAETLKEKINASGVDIETFTNAFTQKMSEIDISKDVVSKAIADTVGVVLKEISDELNVAKTNFNKSAKAINSFSSAVDNSKEKLEGTINSLTEKQSQLSQHAEEISNKFKEVMKSLSNDSTVEDLKNAIDKLTEILTPDAWEAYQNKKSEKTKGLIERILNWFKH